VSRTPQTPELPRWLLLVGSIAIGFHFFAMLMVVLAVRSGPWPAPAPFGSSQQEPPQFATSINYDEWINQYYLQALQMDHNYHFSSNRTDLPTIYFEARLKDANGEVVETIRFPQEKENFWVRQRQQLLAQNLGEDEPVQPPRGEVIAAPGKNVPEVVIWDAPPGQRILQLRSVPEHLIPRDRPVWSPSRWSRALIRSYSQYLCRQFGASAVELIRHSREPLYPALLELPQPPPQPFEELICSYGEYRVEK
jgi:hypothetical protein